MISLQGNQKNYLAHKIMYEAFSKISRWQGAVARAYSKNVESSKCEDFKLQITVIYHRYKISTYKQTLSLRSYLHVDIVSTNDPLETSR